MVVSTGPVTALNLGVSALPLRQTFVSELRPQGQTGQFTELNRRFTSGPRDQTFGSDPLLCDIRAAARQVMLDFALALARAAAVIALNFRARSDP
jgi:hypothetical protein